MTQSLENIIEAILFFRGESLTIAKLVQYTGSTKDEVVVALDSLETSLSGRGIVLVKNGDEVMLGTAKEASSIIETITKEELTRDLGKAGLETLAIVVYKGKASKREIDYIRGVNSGFILRNLLVRGLVDRIEEKGERGYVYTPTIELITYMGIKNLDEMPELAEVRTELEQFLSRPKDTEETVDNGSIS